MFLMEELNKYIWFWWSKVKLIKNEIRVLIDIYVIVKSTTISKHLLLQFFHFLAAVELILVSEA